MERRPREDTLGAHVVPGDDGMLYAASLSGRPCTRRSKNPSNSDLIESASPKAYSFMHRDRPLLIIYY